MIKKHFTAADCATSAVSLPSFFSYTFSTMALLAASSQLALAQSGSSTIHQLPDVVVTTTASERSLNRAMASVSVVDGVTLRRRPVNDLFDAVSDQVGIHQENLGAGGNRGISIRGMSSEHTLMLVDGQRISNTASSIAHSSHELSWVPTEAIERVEVVRGPMSSLYGSESLGGVVNVVTRSATDRWQGSFNQQARITTDDLDGDLYKTGFYLGGPLVTDTLGINLWGEYRYREGLKEEAKPHLYALDKQIARTLHMGLTWTPTHQQRIDLGVDVNRESIDGLRERTPRGRPAYPYHIEYEIRRRRYSLSHQGDWSWGQTQARIYQSRFTRDAQRDDGRSVAAPNRFVDTIADAKISVDLGAHHHVTFGAEVRHEKLEDPNINARQRDSQTHYAFLLQDEISLSDQWEFVVGGRFDKHETFGWQFSPRGYLLYQPTANWSFKAGIGEGFKAPTLKQLSPTFESRSAMGGNGVITGNPDLEAETNLAYEIGATYERDNWRVSATLFRNDVDDLIDTVRLPTCHVHRKICLNYCNVEKARFQGLELSTDLDLSTQWSVSANYTYLSARDRNKDVALTDRSRHRANAQIRWSPMPELMTSVRYEYVGTQLREVSSRGQTRIMSRPAYHLLHWHIHYDVNSSLRLYGGIENFTNERLANDEPELFGRADEGRRFYAGLNFSF